MGSTQFLAKSQFNLIFSSEFKFIKNKVIPSFSAIKIFMLSQKIAISLKARHFASATLVSGLALITSTQVEAATIKVTVESLAPENGTFLTPVWTGFHDGSFDIYNRGEAASPGLESLAEDGDFRTLSEEFLASGAGTVDGAVFGSPVIAPNTTATAIFELDETLPSSRYFSYASMILPSNDAFVANGNPLAHRIFDDNGEFIGADFIIAGNEVLDAGTEVNDEGTTTTAFFGQEEPNTGVTEGGTVQIHPGFIPGGRILSSDRFANADFTQNGYNVARITVEQVTTPEPGITLGLFVLGGIYLLANRQRSRFNQ